MKKKRKNGMALAAVPLYIFTILFVVGPMIYMVAVSFATDTPGSGVDWTLHLGNYRNLLDPVYLQTYVQSFELALSTTVINILVGYPFGYFMSKMSEKGKNRMMLIIWLPFWVNSLIRLYGWIIILQTKGALNKALLGLGLISKPLKLLYSYPAVLLGMVYALLPFMIYAVYSSAEKMDWSLVEASRDLGATKAQTFLNITLPLTLPGLLSGIILTFIPSMGLFFIADILGGNKIVLVGSLIQDQMTRGSNWPFAAAIAVILTILTSVSIWLYTRITNVKELEGI